MAVTLDDFETGNLNDYTVHEGVLTAFDLTTTTPIEGTYSLLGGPDVNTFTIIQQTDAAAQQPGQTVRHQFRANNTTATEFLGYVYGPGGGDYYRYFITRSSGSNVRFRLFRTGTAGFLTLFDRTALPESTLERRFEANWSVADAHSYRVLTADGASIVDSGASAVDTSYNGGVFGWSTNATGDSNQIRYDTLVNQDATAAVTATDAGATLQVTASPLTPTAQSVGVDAGATLQTAATPLTSTESTPVTDVGGVTPSAAAPLTPSASTPVTDGGATTASTASPLVSAEVGGAGEAFDAGATASATASPLTPTATATVSDAGARTAGTATPRTATGTGSARDAAATLQVTASPVIASALAVTRDAGARLQVTASPLSSVETTITDGDALTLDTGVLDAVFAYAATNDAVFAYAATLDAVWDKDKDLRGSTDDT